MLLEKHKSTHSSSSSFPNPSIDLVPGSDRPNARDPIEVTYIATRRGVVAAAQEAGRSAGAHANAKAAKHKAAKKKK